MYKPMKCLIRGLIGLVKIDSCLFYAGEYRISGDLLNNIFQIKGML
ncbi:MAG: hypothetical protein K9L17_12515 [Clostridiales bacterium]|nr:hypothetical protein [Clostridiales bacterium]